MRTKAILAGLLLVLGLATAAVGAAEVPRTGLRYLGTVSAEARWVGRLDDRTLLTRAGEVFDLGDPSMPRRLGSIEWVGWDLETAGGVGYLAAGRSGVVILDVRNPSQPVRLGGYRTSGEARGIEVVGRLAYVAAGEGGLRVLEVGDPSRTDQVGVYPRSLLESLTAHDVRVRGEVAYVAAGADTLEVLAVGNPESMVRLGGMKTGLDAVFMGWLGTRLLLAGEVGGLQLVEVADPRAPVAGDRFDPLPDRPWRCHGIRVEGEVCYVAAGAEGILVVDWTDPVRPRLAGVHRTLSPVLGLGGVGGWVIACHESAGFSVLEPVSGGSMPVRITSQPVGQRKPLGAAVRFEVQVDPASGVNFQWNFAGRPIPGAVGAVLEIAAVTPSDAGAYTVVVTNGGGSVASEVAVLEVVVPPRIYEEPEDVVRIEGSPVRLWVGATSDPTVRYQWSRNGEEIPGATEPGLDLPGLTRAQEGTYSVQVSNLAGSVRSRGAVVAMRARVPLRPVGRWPAVPDEEYARRVKVVGNRVFLAQGMAGLQILDVSVPSQPRRLGGYAGNGYAGGLQVSGDRVYLADGHVGGLVVLDVSDPARPVRMGSLAVGAGVTDVRVVGDLAYVAAGGKGLVIVDVSRPGAMVEVGGTGFSYGASSVEVAGRFAYVADGPGGLLVVDVGTPSKPLVVAQYEKSAFGEFSVRDVRVVGGRALVTCTYEGLSVADLTDPGRPVSVGHGSGYSFGVHVAGNLAYVGGYDTGLRVFDVTTVRPPIEVGFLDTPGEVNDVDTAGGLVFVADGKNGLLILEAGEGGVPAAGRLEWMASADPNRYRVRYPGNQRAVLERSLDLRTWVPVQTNTPAPEASWVEFGIDRVGAAPAGFFRVVR